MYCSWMDVSPDCFSTIKSLNALLDCIDSVPKIHVSFLVKCGTDLIWRSEGENTKVPSDLLCNIACGQPSCKFSLDFFSKPAKVATSLVNLRRATPRRLQQLPHSLNLIVQSFNLLLQGSLPYVTARAAKVSSLLPFWSGAPCRHHGPCGLCCSMAN